LLKSYPLKKFLKKKVLIVGDVGAGKTVVTANLLDQAVDVGYSRKITVIDMAPPTMRVRGVRIGGTLAEITKSTLKVRYLKPARVKAPRVTAKTPQELRKLAKFNWTAIDRLLTKYARKPTPILFINDVSMYLQAGRLEHILRIARKADTFIANGYLGKKLEEDLGSGISRRERTLMHKFMREMDIVIRL